MKILYDSKALLGQNYTQSRAQIVETLLKKHGQFAQVRYSRPLKLRKEYADSGIEIRKATEINAIIGSNYDSRSSVKVSRLDGTLPPTNQGLNSKEWVIPNFILRSKVNDELLFRMYASNNHIAKVSYFKNGKLVNKEEISHYVLSSELNEEHKTVWDVKLVNIDWAR